MAAAFVRHENLFNALKDATGAARDHRRICSPHTSAPRELRFTGRSFSLRELNNNNKKKGSDLRCFKMWRQLWINMAFGANNEPKIRGERFENKIRKINK